MSGKEIHIYREKCLGSTRSALIYERLHVEIISIMLIMRLSKLETYHTHLHEVNLYVNIFRFSRFVSDLGHERTSSLREFLDFTFPSCTREKFNVRAYV